MTEKILIYSMVAVLGLATLPVAAAGKDASPETLFRVEVTANRVEAGVEYHYTLVNLHPDWPALGIVMGTQEGLEWERPALASDPVGLDYKKELSGQGRSVEYPVLDTDYLTIPEGWNVFINTVHGYSAFWFLEIKGERDEAYELTKLLPGEQIQVSITVPKADPSYTESLFYARFVGWPGKGFRGRIEKHDKVAPTLKLSAEDVVWSEAGKAVRVTVDASYADDTDCAPELRLLSLISSEKLPKGQRWHEEIGTDQTEFSLLPSSQDDNPEGRDYTFTYQAMDASGNATEKSIKIRVKQKP